MYGTFNDKLIYLSCEELMHKILSAVL